MKSNKASAFSILRGLSKSYSIENAQNSSTSKSPTQVSSLKKDTSFKQQKKKKFQNKTAKFIKSKLYGTPINREFFSLEKSHIKSNKRKSKKERNFDSDISFNHDDNHFSDDQNLENTPDELKHNSTMREHHLQNKSAGSLSSGPSSIRHSKLLSPSAANSTRFKKSSLTQPQEIQPSKTNSKRLRQSLEKKNEPSESDTTQTVGKGDEFDEKKKILPLLPYMFDSSVESQKLFQWLISPVEPHRFLKNLWERKPLLVKRHHSKYFNGIFSTKELDRILREENVQYSQNIDITTYNNGERQTHNLHGRAYPSTVWDFYQSGCSVRLLNPQTYNKEVWKLNTILQEYFGSFVGANVYLTPPGAQGFAPHYDDIEAFILQLEGKKHWRLYNPRSESETLPRISSKDFQQDKIGSPILEIELEAGDLLYFPRGTIHQADCPEDSHSLHITLSTYQKNTWGDLLEKVVPQALQLAIKEDTEFRRALPKDYFSYMGIANCDMENSQRTTFLRKVQQLLGKLLSFAPVDAAVDQMAKEYIHTCLPPYLTDGERACSVHGNGEFWENDNVVNAVELEPETKVKLIRKDIARLVMEDDKVLIYYSMENSRNYKADEAQYMEITPEKAPAVEFLMHSYPEYTAVENLPLESLEEKLEVVTMLYEKGLVITSEPLEPLVD